MTIQNYFDAISEYTLKLNDNTMTVAEIATWLYIYDNFYLHKIYNFSLKEYMESANNKTLNEIKEKVLQVLISLSDMKLLSFDGSRFHFDINLILHSEKFKH